MPSWALFAGRDGLAGISPQAGVDGVADPPFEGPECFFVGLALGDLAVVVGAAVSGTTDIAAAYDRVLVTATGPASIAYITEE